MIYWQVLLLFLATLSGGAILFVLPTLPSQVAKLLMPFGGSYLFSITLVHLLPAFFEATGSSHWAGLYLLLGFYLQLFLTFIGQGVAHCCHIHTTPDSNHQSKKSSTLLLIFALAVHSLLEGLLLGIDLQHIGGHHHHHHHHLSHNMILVGMILHKIPAAFALTTTLIHWGKKRNMILAALIFFSSMTPLSWIVSHHAQTYSSILVSHLQILAGLATGGLLHIASTILFESDTQHQLSPSKWLAIGLGAGIAILTGIIE